MLPRGKVGCPKYYFQGQELHAAPVLLLSNRARRTLRWRNFRTASEALTYAEHVLIRYQRWCDVALAKIMTDAQK
jgi:hypothetical protein